MNETWTSEETAMYALVVTCLEEDAKKPAEEDETKELEVLEGEVEEVAPPPFYKRPIPRRWGILLCSCLLILSTVFSTILILLFTATATITVELQKKPVSFQQTFTIPVTHTFTNTKFLTQTAKATGSGHQDATHATGFVTFFNALQTPQTITAGTLLVGADGTHIITNEDAFIPAGSLATNGQVTVSAHVTTSGSQGNIQAGDFSGPCCRDYVFARTGQFTGGQDERNFTVVSQSDVNNIHSILDSSLDSRVQADLQGQISKQEVLSSPVCNQIASVNPQVGEEAQEVTVTLTKKCSAVSYNQVDFANQVDKYFKTIVGTKFESSYTPVGSPQISILSTSIKENTVKISAIVNGTMVYHFRKADMDKLKRLVAGKSKEQVGQIILKWHDIRMVGIELQYSQNSLPNDPERIKVRVKS